MYSLEEIKTIIRNNSFKSKICAIFDDSFLVSVPNFKEYHHLFGNGRTFTCYAKESRYWNDYHRGFYQQIDFLSASKHIDNKFSYISFCVSDVKIETNNVGNGHWDGYVSGYICIHDFLHNSYPIIKFESLCYKNKDYIGFDKSPRMDINYGVSNACFEKIVSFRDFEQKYGNGLVKTVINIVCENIIKDRIKCS